MSNHKYIPSEIIIDILNRLPVVSLLRFTSVCMLWYCIITNPKFITTHLNRSRERSTAQLLLSVYKRWARTSWERKGLLINEDDKILSELAFPSVSSKNIHVVGSCNGLICLADGYKDRAKHVIIWNPTIRKSVTLTLPKKQPQRLMWFGFVLGENKYKVVNICGPSLSWVEVYEQGGDWRVTECATPSSWQGIVTKLAPALAVVVLGALHWLTYDITTMTYHSIIVFDMQDEVLREIGLPPELLQPQPSANFSITSLCDSLVLMYHGYGSSGRVGLWLMMDYGVLGYWTKMYDIVLPSCLLKALGFKNIREILHQIRTYYDPETKSDTSIIIQNYVLDPITHYFGESLILLQGRKALTDRFAHLL